jgi:hypothetical protein
MVAGALGLREAYARYKKGKEGGSPSTGGGD